MPVFNKMVLNWTEYILWWWGNIWEPLNLTVTTSWLDATITWEDNEIWTIPPTTFQKSELVRKIGSAPTSPSDWTLVVTETVKDTYKVSGYVDQWLTDWETYYYRVFSYSDLGGISYCDAESVTISNSWNPWANTIWYWKLNWNLNDEMWNYNWYVTGGWSVSYVSLPWDSSVKCAQVYSNWWDTWIGLPNTICNQIFAAQTSYSFWGFVKKPSNWDAELLYMQSYWGGWMCCSIRNWKFYFWTDGQSEIYYPSNAVISANTWYSVVFTYNHTTRTKSFYANWTLIGTSTESSDYSTSSNPNKAYLARINSYLLLSNLFLETNKVRDEQEAKLFHDTFKSLYWIS